MPPFKRDDINEALASTASDLDMWRREYGEADCQCSSRHDLLHQRVAEWSAALERQGPLA